MSGWTPINYYTSSIDPHFPGAMQPTHAGQGRIIGEDGKRYAVIQMNPAVNFSHYPVLYCYDTNTTVFFGASEGLSQSLTKLQADIDTLALPGAPSGSNFVWIDETIAVSDSKYFVVIGQYEPGSANELAFVRYKIDSGGAIALVDGFITRASTNRFGRYHIINWRGITNQSQMVDCRIIGSTLYMAGSGESLVSNIYDTILLTIPLSTFGTCDTTNGSYDAYVTVLKHGPNFLWPFNPGYVNGQRGCIVQVSGNVGLLAYAGAGSIQNTSWGNEFFSGGAEYNGNPRLIFAYDNSGFTDYGATYGIPFSDVLYDYGGSLGTNENDDYNGPSLMTKSGKDYIVFTRVYHDNQFKMRFKAFRWGAATNLVQDWTGSFFNSGYFPGDPTRFAPVSLFFSPDGSGHLILQSDYLNDNANGTWRLFADFGPIDTPTTTRARIWGFVPDQI